MPLILEEQTYQLRGALFQVYRELKNSGISEEAWENALAIVLTERGIPHKEQTPFPVLYKGTQIGFLVTDVIAWDRILLELKVAPEGLSPIHTAQTLSYLKITGFELGLLVNFGAADIEIKRVPNFINERTQRETAPDDARASDGLMLSELTYALRAALLEVHGELGPGFIHYIYRRATQIELQARGIPFEFKKQISVMFHDQPLQTVDCRLIVVDNCIAVAAFALKEISEAHRQKLERYSRWLGVKMTLLANFYKPSLEIETIRI
ncbi:MAG: GxxExxY protein [Chloroflexi bacterium]|nr:GxxExxY protein [Chloroflexota bacterium]